VAGVGKTKWHRTRAGAPPSNNPAIVETVIIFAVVATPLALTPELLLGYDVTPNW